MFLNQKLALQNDECIAWCLIPLTLQKNLRGKKKNIKLINVIKYLQRETTVLILLFYLYTRMDGSHDLHLLAYVKDTYVYNCLIYLWPFVSEPHPSYSLIGGTWQVQFSFSNMIKNSWEWYEAVLLIVEVLQPIKEAIPWTNASSRFQILVSKDTIVLWSLCSYDSLTSP